MDRCKGAQEITPKRGLDRPKPERSTVTGKNETGTTRGLPRTGSLPREGDRELDAGSLVADRYKIIRKVRAPIYFLHASPAGISNPDS
jgi:hypothetical protein